MFSTSKNTEGAEREALLRELVQDAPEENKQDMLELIHKVEEEEKQEKETEKKKETEQKASSSSSEKERDT